MRRQDRKRRVSTLAPCRRTLEVSSPYTHLLSLSVCVCVPARALKKMSSRSRGLLAPCLARMHSLALFLSLSYAHTNGRYYSRHRQTDTRARARAHTHTHTHTCSAYARTNIRYYCRDRRRVARPAMLMVQNARAIRWRCIRRRRRRKRQTQKLVTVMCSGQIIRIVGGYDPVSCDGLFNHTPFRARTHELRVGNKP